MLRVLFLVTSLVRQGPINVIYNMLKGAKKSKSEIDFRILTLSKESCDSRLNDFEELGILIYTMGYSDGYSAIFHLREIEAKINEIKPHILHSSCFRPDIVASKLKLQDVVKISSLWNYPYEDYTSIYGKFKGSLMAWYHLHILKSFNTVTVCSTFIASRIHSYKIPLGIIYTGVDTNFFKSISDDVRIQRRKAMGIKPTDIVFIYIANFISRKNPLNLIKAFKSFENKDAKLLLMGDGVLMEESVKLAQGDERIYFLGRKQGTINELQISDFYVSPSFSEGFPTAVLEAASVGLIPILSDIKPHMELITNDPNHLSFDANCPETLTHCFYDAAIKGNIYNYRKLVVDHFSDVQMYYNYHEIYKYVSGNIFVK